LELIFGFGDDHGHEFGFGVFEAFFEYFILGQVRVFDVLSEEGALDADVGV
jgi:hypothetical protein